MHQVPGALIITIQNRIETINHCIRNRDSELSSTIVQKTYIEAKSITYRKRQNLIICDFFQSPYDWVQNKTIRFNGFFFFSIFERYNISLLRYVYSFSTVKTWALFKLKIIKDKNRPSVILPKFKRDCGSKPTVSVPMKIVHRLLFLMWQISRFFTTAVENRLFSTKNNLEN